MSLNTNFYIFFEIFFGILPALHFHYVPVEKGQLYTPDYRVFIKNNKDGKFVSPWHDIPLYAENNEENKLFNMVVEIPRWSQAKMEMTTGEAMTPIRQDVLKGKKGSMRFVHNVYPFKGYIWNYGALPQTWEDPNPAHKNEFTNAIGDNDPIDVVEIGSKIHPTGSVIKVKILGVLAMLDDGETDWKLVAIDAEDKLAEKLNDIGDVEREMPGYLEDTVKWFRDYKRPEGKEPNKFALKGKFQNREFAYKIIEETNEFWKELIKSEKKPEKINNECHIESAVNKANDDAWEKKVNEWTEFEEAAEIPVEIQQEWYFVKENPKTIGRRIKTWLSKHFRGMSRI